MSDSATARTLTMAVSRVVAGDLDTTFARVLALPLNELFTHRYGPLPPVVSTEGPLPWGTPGQRRRVNLSDGGSFAETLTAVVPPEQFSYRLDDIQGPMRPLVAFVDGRWSFRAAPGGTEVTWTWAVAAQPYAGFALPVFARLWARYAERALGTLDGAPIS